MDKHQNFVQNLEAIRTAKGQSLSEFAKEVGIPRSTMQSVLENGQTTLDTAIRISEGLDISLDALMGVKHTAREMDISCAVLKCLSGYQALSEEQKEKVEYYVRKIVEVLRYDTEGPVSQ